jgi:hypothetical protein
MIPILVVTAGYLVWEGASRPGGAFQAGAVLGGAGVLLLLAEGDSQTGMRVWLSRPLLALGPAFFAGVGAIVAVAGQHVLEYPPGWGKALILLIECLAAISIGAALTAMFAWGAALRSDATERSSER